MADGTPAWLTKTPRRKPGPGELFVTSNRYNFFYLQITKCGCTFMRNLIYYLDHDRPHDNAKRIHAHHDDFINADLVPLWLLRKNDYVFTVVRNPVDRFLSLYFDKIANLDSRYDMKMRTQMIENAGLDVQKHSPLGTHQQNCLKTLAWIEKNINGETQTRVDPHWRRQSGRISRAKEFPLKCLTLEGLSWQLPQLLEPIVPNIRAAMASVKSRNVSQKPFSRSEMVTPELEAAVLQVYKKDAQIYAEAVKTWGEPPAETTGLAANKE